MAEVSIVALGLAPALPLALVAMVLAGFFWECFFVTAQIGLEVETPASMLGREMGLFYALTLGGLAIGAPLIGLLFDHVGVRVGLVIGGAFLIVFDTWRLSRLRRRLRHEIGAADQPVDVDVIAPAGGLADSPAHERKLA